MRLTLTPALLFLLAPWLSSCANMNQGGPDYAISNPPGSTSDWEGTPGVYTTQFEKNVEGEVEHFDVYGEVQTLYSQVYWTRNSPVDLPASLVSRFAGKVMAITGYEVDQVTHPGAKVRGATPCQFSLSFQYILAKLLWW